MRIVVLCPDPEVARSAPESAAAVLTDLGCMVVLGRLDLGGLDLEELRRRPANMIVIDAGEESERARRTLRAMQRSAALAEIPKIVTVTVARLPALDFSIGFDDFVLRPLVPAELYARLRQLDWQSATFSGEEVTKIGDLVLDAAGYEATVRGRRVNLTRLEFELVRFLAQHRGRVFSRDELLERVWNYKHAGTRTIDNHVRRVRAKLGPEVGGLIETVRNVGYKMRADRPPPGGDAKLA